MGDRTYVRFTIPVTAIVTVRKRRTLAAILELTVTELLSILQSDPTTTSPVAGYDNECVVRLVEDMPCLVWEHDECNYGGSEMEEELQNAGIPFIKYNCAGCEYDAGRTAFAGSGDLYAITCDEGGQPMIRINVVDRRAVVKQQELNEINDLLRVEHAVLHYGR